MIRVLRFDLRPMQRQRWATLPWMAQFLAGSLCGLTLSGLVLLALVARGGADPADDRVAESIPLVATVAAIGVVGSALAARRPRNPIGWLLAAAGLAIGWAFVLGGYATMFMNRRMAVAPDVAAWTGSWGLFAGLILFAMALMVFPDGRLPSRAWRLPAAVCVVALGLAGLALAFAPGETLQGGNLRNPFGLGGPVGEALTGIQSLIGALQVLGLGVAVAAPISRYRTAMGDARLQLRLLAFTTALIPIGLLLAGTLLYGTTLGFYAVTLPFALVPVAMVVAVLKYRLYDVDAVIGRAALYGALTASIVALYVALVGGLSVLFQSTGNMLISLVATGVVAVIFQPLRERLQAVVSRLVNGERGDPYRILTDLGRRLEETLSPADVLATIVAVTRGALDLRYCAIVIPDGGTSVVAAESGDPDPDPTRVRLAYHGEPVGELLLGFKRGERLNPADSRLVADLARQFGVAIHAVRLTEDLRRSRERLVTAREEERRRLRRDLHDGLGPRLASLALRLETARDHDAPDDRTRALLNDLADRCRESVTDIRRLIYALRPPVLDDLGLLSAVREGAALAAEGASGPLEVKLEVPLALPLLPAAVEVAAYRIVQEALTNVAKHASARYCAVKLAIDSDGHAMCVEIQDDGKGIGQHPRAGVGLASMRERAEELGGSFSVGASPVGGTRVAARLPWRRGEEGQRSPLDDLAAAGTRE